MAVTASNTHERGELGGSGVARYAVEHRRAGSHHKAGPALGDGRLGAARRQRDISRVGLDEREPETEPVLAAPGGLELSRGDVHPVGRAPHLASQAEKYAVPQPSSTTSRLRTSPSTPACCSGRLKMPQVMSLGAPTATHHLTPATKGRASAPDKSVTLSILPDKAERARPPLWPAVSGRWNAVHVAPNGLICALHALADTADVSFSCRIAGVARPHTYSLA